MAAIPGNVYKSFDSCCASIKLPFFSEAKLCQIKNETEKNGKKLSRANLILSKVIEI